MPELAAEWDYEKNLPLKPNQVTCYSHRKVHWKCSTCGHSWQSRINNRIQCPHCKTIKQLESKYSQYTTSYITRIRIDEATRIHHANGELTEKQISVLSSVDFSFNPAVSLYPSDQHFTSTEDAASALGITPEKLRSAILKQTKIGDDYVYYDYLVPPKVQAIMLSTSD